LLKFSVVDTAMDLSDTLERNRRNYGIVALPDGTFTFKAVDFENWKGASVSRTLLRSSGLSNQRDGGVVDCLLEKLEYQEGRHSFPSVEEETGNREIHQKEDSKNVLVSLELFKLINNAKPQLMKSIAIDLK
jgi:hypothetical protein